MWSGNSYMFARSLPSLSEAVPTAICQYILSSGIFVNSKKPLNEAVTTEN